MTGSFRCGAPIQRKGTPCKRRVKSEGLKCFKHDKEIKEMEIFRCGSIDTLKNGKPCNQRVSTKGIRCYNHIDKDEQKSLYNYCAGTTQKNNPCTYKVKTKGSFCKFHGKKKSEEVKSDILTVEDITEEGEIWKSAEPTGFSSYKVSSHYRVWSDKSNRILKGYENAHGYRVFKLTNNKGEQKQIKRHNLVGQLFLGLTEKMKKEGITMDHENRDPTDDRIENLRHATKSEQAKNRTLRGSTGK